MSLLTMTQDGPPLNSQVGLDYTCVRRFEISEEKLRL